MAGVLFNCRPNIITLLDFLSILISHIIIAYYSWDFTTPLPRWVCVVGGVCYFLYFTMDCLDGKQARKTKSSSPLGMMFDHGCDALGSPLSLCNMMALVQSNSPTITIVCMLIVLTGFYIATYETYYIGGLFLGKINPVTDGSVLITILYILTGIIGTQMWTTTLFTMGDIPITFFYIVFFMVFLGTLIGNVQSFMHIIYDSKEKPSALRMIHEFFSVELLIATVAILHYTTPLWKNHTRIMIYIFGIMFTKLNVYTLAMQMVKSPLKISIKSIVVPCGLLLALTGVKMYGYINYIASLETNRWY
jgi:ethanolaminephosphotransferase